MAAVVGAAVVGAATITDPTGAVVGSAIVGSATIGPVTPVAVISTNLTVTRRASGFLTVAHITSYQVPNTVALAGTAVVGIALAA